MIADEWKYTDAFRSIHREKKDEEVVICAHDTRIDYIYVHSRVNDERVLTKCEIIDTEGSIDHNVVLAELELISK